jgi:hypothetical protein
MRIKAADALGNRADGSRIAMTLRVFVPSW